MRKKTLTVLLLVITAQLAQAQMTWSQIMSWKDKIIKPDAQYSIETEGYNVRIYEFTPLTDPGSSCVMSFTNEKMSMFCFGKSDKALKK